MPVWLILVLPGVLLRNETTRYEAAEERNSNFEEEKRIGRDRGTDFQTREGAWLIRSCTFVLCLTSFIVLSCSPSQLQSIKNNQKNREQRNRQQVNSNE
jgi:hypothetical protein